MTRLVTRARRLARVAARGAWALLDRRHPILAQVVPMRRCNLACAYCNEYDSTSQPVPLASMLAWLDKLADLGTSMITVSGGEPLMHPGLDAMIAHMRRRGMVSSVITNGYYLSPERIDARVLEVLTRQWAPLVDLVVARPDRTIGDLTRELRQGVR